MGCDSLMRLYERENEEIDALLELHMNMLGEGMDPREFVGYQKYTPSLKRVHEEVHRGRENLAKIEEDIKGSELTRKLIKMDVDGLTVDRARLDKKVGGLFARSSYLEKKVEWLKRREIQLHDGISALKNDAVYRKLTEYITEDKGLGIVNDEDFVDSIIRLFLRWSTDPATQSRIKKLLECKKKNDGEGVSEIIRKFKEEWLLDYAIRYGSRNSGRDRMMNPDIH